ncbi:MAG: thiamine pyrophosphate-binding protein [Alphaproteobacteria bacterium]|nr:thiamine pyrophosphate-binding protein [Alphaproteobacteria bacterium SS10]
MLTPTPPQAAKTTTGGEILVEQLITHGVDTIFGVPGESYLGVLDAMYPVEDKLRFIIARVENGAANMAEAYGKLTGKPGVCMVTRGPGATHASIGIHTAMQDSTPMVVLIGQVGRKMKDREAFQEVDYKAAFGPLAKWVAEIDHAERIPEYMARAFHTAQSGRPGPVVLSLPEDLTSDLITLSDDDKPRRPVLPAATTLAGPQASQIEQAMAMLAKAERPFVILGGPSWDDAGVAAITRFAEANKLPVGCSFRAQDRFDNRHPNYAGDVGIGINPKLGKAVMESDLLLVMGPRLGEMTTGGYSRIVPPRSQQPMIHIHPSDMELGSVYQPDLAIQSGLSLAAEALAAQAPVANPVWSDWAAERHADYLENIAERDAPGPLNMSTVVAHLNEVLPEDAIVCNGAGNSTAWLHRHFQYRGFRTQAAPTSGAMGYGVPAAVAASIVYPERTVVSVVGDGCFQMAMAELGTASQYDAAPILIVVNNSMYGTIRMHQEREYPDRVIATDLVNPDFVALAKSYGWFSQKVERTEDFAPAFAAAKDSGKAALLELIIDPEAITTRQTLSEIRGTGVRAQR